MKMDEKAALGSQSPASQQTAPHQPDIPPAYYGSSGNAQLPGYSTQPVPYNQPPPSNMAYNQPGVSYPPPPPPVIMAAHQLGRFPTPCTCPKCHENIVTVTTMEHGTATWLLCLFIFLLGGGILCLCFIPFCINDMKDVHHSCPKCYHKIGVNTRM